MKAFSRLGGFRQVNQPYRSGLEDHIAAELAAAGIKASYEEYVLPYTVPSSNHTYTPDFVLPNGIIVEAKGIFDAADRAKHLLVKKEYPHLDIRFVFSNPKAKIYKGSKTTLAAWCEKYGYQYAAREIPPSWFAEPMRDTTGLRKKVKAHRI